MTKPLTVRDRHGNLVERVDGKMLDGDQVQGIRVSLMLMDNASTATPATLASAAQILGDGYNEDEIAKLSDQAARHAVVRKRIGADAEGRPAAYLDAAWGALAGTGSPAAAPVQAGGALPMSMLTDTQRAFAADAVKRALADAGAGSQRVQDVSTASRAQVPLPPRRATAMLSDAERKAGDDRIRGAYAAMKSEMSDGWRDGSPPAVTLDPRVEAAFRDGKITDTPTNRARAELAQELSDGWKAGR